MKSSYPRSATSGVIVRGFDLGFRIVLGVGHAVIQSAIIARLRGEC